MALPSFMSAKPKTEDTEVLTAIREAAAASEMTEKFVDSMHGARTDSISNASVLREQLKLDKLVADDFPFDESQIEMIEGIIDHVIVNGGQGACATGAAGTGKTTSTKKIVDRIIESADFIRAVDMDSYFKKKDGPSPEDDEYEQVSRWVPSIALVGFTGRSTQMIKKNFPRSWHGNIMTIHRLLGFMPVWEEQWDDELNEMRNRMRFEPSFNAINKLPWDVVVIDEAGMVGLDLWEQLRVALKDTCKVIMIGDINQLPPVHGRSVFGFAMGTWPAWELTHVHRQQDSQDKIVDNAWRILKGQMPVSEGNFQLVKFDDMAGKASQQLRKFLPQLTDKGIYDPIRDSCITATNGEDGQRGYALGQKPLNREFAIIFNKDNPRYIIDAGRERQKFAVGDKVMATRNDHEAGITNGMTGIITSIERNAAWSGDTRRFGSMEEVNKWAAEDDRDADDDADDVSVEDMLDSYGAQEMGRKNAKEAKDRGPSSHIVTVRFGTGDHGFEIPFATLAEVASLMTAYVVTCHKMQGGECPVVVIVLHTAHKAMHFREWLYTAVTRGSEKVIVLYTDLALRGVLNKQKIKGSTLAQKVESFMALSREGLVGAAVNVKLTWGPMSQLPMERPTTQLSDEPVWESTDRDERGFWEWSLSQELQRKLIEAYLNGRWIEPKRKPQESDISDAEWEEVTDSDYSLVEAGLKALPDLRVKLLPYYGPTGFPADLTYVMDMIEQAKQEVNRITGISQVLLPPSPASEAQTGVAVESPKPRSLAFLMAKQKG